MSLLDNLVSYWKMDEASGTRVDAHGSNDLTDVNTVGNATGIINLGADFERSNSESLRITNAAQTGLNITGDLSVSFWIKQESATAGQYPNLISKFGGAGNRAYSIGLWDTENIISLTVSADGTALTGSDKSFNPTPGTWYYVAVRYDASAGEGEIFIDGSSLGATTGLATSIFSCTEAFIVGSDPSTFFFDGIIDEVGIWDRYLTSTEITDLYNGGAGLSYDDFGTAGPANLKTYNTNVKANIKTMNTNPIANVKTFDTNA